MSEERLISTLKDVAQESILDKVVSPEELNLLDLVFTTPLENF
jgi:hypothetical protein